MSPDNIILTIHHQKAGVFNYTYTVADAADWYTDGATGTFFNGFSDSNSTIDYDNSTFTCDELSWKCGDLGFECNSNTGLLITSVIVAGVIGGFFIYRYIKKKV